MNSRSTRHIYKTIHKTFNQRVNYPYTIPYLPQMPTGGPLASAPPLQRRGRLLQTSQTRNGPTRTSLHLCWQGDKREDKSRHWINTNVMRKNSLWTLSERKGRGCTELPYTVNKHVDLLLPADIHFLAAQRVKYTTTKRTEWKITGLYILKIKGDKKSSVNTCLVLGCGN